MKKESHHSKIELQNLVKRRRTMTNCITSVYIISPRTKAIILKELTYYRSLIIEENRERKSLHKPEQIIDNSCLVYGSTLEGRKGAVRDILKTSSKLPIPVIPEMGVYMIPTASTKNKSCVWVAYHHIHSYQSHDQCTSIQFNDGSNLLAHTSLNTFDMQYKRTSQIIVHMNRSFLFSRGNPSKRILR